MIKKEVDVLDVTPSKRLYRSIIADYGLNQAISELIDNVIDSRVRQNIKRVVRVSIILDIDDQTITIEDNAGGVAQGELAKLISPGASHNNGEVSSIGVFGVGSKRAAVALARDIRISTRHMDSERSFQIEYDDSWLQQDEWEIPYYEIDSLRRDTTMISFSRLRIPIDEKVRSDLEIHLSKTYAQYINDKDIEIEVNGALLGPIEFNQWAFPPDALPVKFEKRLKIEGMLLPILFNITSGLTYEQGSIGGNWGVYVYCNRRLICSACRDSEMGFHSGVAGVAHPRMSNARIIVELIGGAAHLPWNSSKTGINYNHEVYKAIRDDLYEAVKNSTKLSNRMQPDYACGIAPFRAGTINAVRLEPEQRIRPSRLPPIPKARISTKDTIIEANKAIGKSKPWTVGAYEALAAVEIIKKQRSLSQRNRIVLIVLDSTLEIAFKEYLVNDSGCKISEDKLASLFQDRTQVHGKIREYIFQSDEELWRQVKYYYMLRCELIHKRATLSVTDQQIAIFQELVNKLLHEMFGLDL